MQIIPICETDDTTEVEGYARDCYAKAQIIGLPVQNFVYERYSSQYLITVYLEEDKVRIIEITNNVGIGVGGTSSSRYLTVSTATIATTARAETFAEKIHVAIATIAVTAENDTTRQVLHEATATIAIQATAVTNKSVIAVSTVKVAAKASSTTSKTATYISTMKEAAKASAVIIKSTTHTATATVGTKLSTIKTKGAVHVATAATATTAAARYVKQARLTSTATIAAQPATLMEGIKRTVDRWDVASTDTPWDASGAHGGTTYADLIRVGTTGQLTIVSNIGRTVTYASSNPAVATIHPTTGAIVVASLGGAVRFSATIVAGGGFPALTLYGGYHQLIKLSVGITMANMTVTYTGQVYSLTATTMPAGRTVTYTYNGSAYPQTNVGVYEVIATCAGDQNYDTVTATAYLTIVKAYPTITWNPQNIVYGTLLDNSVLTASSGNVPGTWVYSLDGVNPIASGRLGALTLAPEDERKPNATTGLQINYVFTPDDTGNYHTISGWNGMEVLKADQTITWVELPPTSIDRGATIFYSATASSGLPVLYTMPDAYDMTMNSAFTWFFGNNTIGSTFRVVVSQAGDINYNPAPTITSTTLITGLLSSGVNWNNWADMSIPYVASGQTVNSSRMNATASAPGTFSYTLGTTAPLAGLYLEGGAYDAVGMFTPSDPAYSGDMKIITITVAYGPLSYSITGANQVTIKGGQRYSNGYAVYWRYDDGTTTWNGSIQGAYYQCNDYGNIITLFKNPAADYWCHKPNTGLLIMDAGGGQLFIPFQAGFTPPDPFYENWAHELDVFYPDSNYNRYIAYDNVDGHTYKYYIVKNPYPGYSYWHIPGSGAGIGASYLLNLSVNGGYFRYATYLWEEIAGAASVSPSDTYIIWKIDILRCS